MSRKNRERKAANRTASPGGSATMRLYWILGVVAVLGVGYVGYSVASGGDQGATLPIEVEGLDDPQQLVAMATGMVMGEEGAPVTIVEFGDYQCPGCAYFAMTVKPQIVSEFVETGKARFVFYDFPLVGSGHPHSFLAARAVRCAIEEDRGWDFQDVLYYNQSQWSTMADPTDEFVGYAEQLGMDDGAFEDCLRSDRYADVVTANLRLGQQLRVSGTPTVLVGAGNGSTSRRIGMANDPWVEISEEVERLLAAQGVEDGSMGGEEGEAGSSGG